MEQPEQDVKNEEVDKSDNKQQNQQKQQNEQNELKKQINIIPRPEKKKKIVKSVKSIKSDKNNKSVRSRQKNDSLKKSKQKIDDEQDDEYDDNSDDNSDDEDVDEEEQYKVFIRIVLQQQQNSSCFSKPQKSVEYNLDYIYKEEEFKKVTQLISRLLNDKIIRGYVIYTNQNKKANIIKSKGLGVDFQNVQLLLENDQLKPQDITIKEL